MPTFSSLNLSENMINNLKNINYVDMTPIQNIAIPPIIKKKDIIAQAKTGSGKTAAFAVGILETLVIKYYRIQKLILCPTRELANQVAGEIRKIARFEHNIKLLVLTGGIPMYKQEQSLNHHAHIVVGTPGRILKLLNREKLILDDVTTVVLDEADRMLEMGFIDQVDEIMNFAPVKIQTLLFSATFPPRIKEFAKSRLKNPVDIRVEVKHNKNTIIQHFYKVEDKEKIDTLVSILLKFTPKSVIIFCNTKDACRTVYNRLNTFGIKTLVLNGDIDQKQRTETFIRFSNGSARVLVATDIAARGLDIDDLGAVINYDLPFDPETYIHRVGRTGRAGKKGLAFSLMTDGEEFRLTEISKLINDDIHPLVYESNININKINHELLMPDMITVSVNGGRKQKVGAGDILGVLTSNKNIKGSDVGKINRLDYLTFVAVKRSLAQTALNTFKTNTIKGRSYLAIINDD